MGRFGTYTNLLTDVVLAKLVEDRVCFAAKLPTSLPAGLEEPAVVPALLALEHPRQCPGSVEGRPRGLKGQTTS